jgi:anti-sigma regulatory factor (Ser/Thr protein kinase)
MASDRFRIEIPNSHVGLKQLLDHFGKFAVSQQLPVEVRREIQLVLDEVVSNIINHGYADSEPHTIIVALAVEDRVLEIEVVDDARPFNPLRHDAPRTDQSLAERPVGGLGIHLVKQLMDDVAYNRRDGLNHLTLRMRIDSEGPSDTRR